MSFIIPLPCHFTKYSNENGNICHSITLEKKPKMRSNILAALNDPNFNFFV